MDLRPGVHVLSRLLVCVVIYGFCTWSFINGPVFALLLGILLKYC